MLTMKNSTNSNAKFAQRASQQRHVSNEHINAVHENLKLFKCKNCPKTISHWQILRAHCQKVHEDLSLLCCKISSEGISWKEYWNSHINAVLGKI